MTYKEQRRASDYPVKNSWRQAVFSRSFPLESRLGKNDFWVMLFICCLSLFAHKLFWFIPAYILYKTRIRMVVKKEMPIAPPEIEQIVSFIQMNRLQSLTEAIESNPLLLHCEFKKKDLLSWCKFYNNTKALMVVIHMTKKYPLEKMPQAA
jgi:hypothetical protein